MMPFEVACIGLATADTIVSLPAWPRADDRMLADAILRSGGGPAATAAVTLARLGHRVAMIGTIGDDELGAPVRSGLAQEGVDVTHLATMPGRTAESVILLDRSRATRTILHAPGAALTELSVDARAACAAASWVHVDHAGARLAASLDARRRSIDAGGPVEGLALDGVGLYAPSAAMLRERYRGTSVHSAVHAALAEGAERVVVTLGAEGALAADATGAWRVAGPPVEVVSTLGAGDVFHGALLASLLDGLSLSDAARRAVVAATLSCRALDGRSAIPSPLELDAAMRRAPSVEPITLEAAR